MSVTIVCPLCGTKGEIEDFQEGVEVRCPSCGEKFVLDQFSISEAEEPIPHVSKKLPLPPPPPVSPATQAPKTSSKTSETKQNNAQEKPSNAREKPGTKEADAQGHKSDQVPSSGNATLKLLLIVMVVMMGIMCVQMANVNSKLDALSPKDNPIVDTRLISYTWEEEFAMEYEFKKAIRDGYEPAGYVCQNSIKGGFFLFVKRKK